MTRRLNVPPAGGSTRDISTTVNRLLDDIGKVEEMVTTEVEILRNEVASESRAEIRVLQGEVSVAERDITNLRSTIASFQQTVSNLQNDVRAFQRDIDSLERDDERGKLNLNALRDTSNDRYEYLLGEVIEAVGFRNAPGGRRKLVVRKRNGEELGGII